VAGIHFFWTRRGYGEFVAGPVIHAASIFRAKRESTGESRSLDQRVHLYTCTRLKGSRGWKPRSLAGRMPASTVAVRFQRASEGGFQPPVSCRCQDAPLTSPQAALNKHASRWDSRTPNSQPQTQNPRPQMQDLKSEGQIPLQCGLRLNPCFADNTVFLKGG
jgi:hypothetical protein